MGEHQFEYAELLDELRCRETGWLEVAREEAVREQRRWRLRELAVLAVLDERGRVDDSLAVKDGTRTRDLDRMRKTAKHLAGQPHLAYAAAQGRLSDEQLDTCSALAGDDPDADRRWANDGPGWSPADLADELRRQRTPTIQDAVARRKARALRYWWRPEGGMLDGRFSLPDVDGALFETVINDLVERMRPAKGHPWDTRDHRGADALVELCRAHTAHTDHEPSSGPGVHLVVQVPLHGPATVAGVPLPDAMVESLRAQARIEPVLTDHHGEPVAVGRSESVLSDKTRRVVRLRDGKCRWPGCEHRRGLQVHHLWPASWGGSDQIANLASVCAPHHTQLAPQGPWLLLGNPNHPAGLTLTHRDHPTQPDETTKPTETSEPGGGRATKQARAGPHAA